VRASKSSAQVITEKILFGLVLSVCAACGSEPAPWSGFPLFPGLDAAVPADATTQVQPPVQSPVAGEQGVVSLASAAGSGGGASPSVGPTMVITAPAAGSGDATKPAIESVQPMSDAFRITQLYLRDPHMFVGISDVTDKPVLNVSINQILLPDKLTMDGDRDGFLDVSMILLLPRLEAANGGIVVATSGKCATSTPTRCNRDLEAQPEATWPIEVQTNGACLEPIAATTSAYQPAITLPTAPCFVTSVGKDLVFDLGGVALPVIGAKLSATYRAQPSPALVNGLLTGFVTNTAAKNAQLPDAAGAPTAGSSFGDFVKQDDHDQASSPSREDGFWIYLNFVAEPIEYTP
jgi:hypothetical protein